MHPSVHRQRMRVRLSVRLRREGGSLSLTIPCLVVRRWKLEPGDRLIVRSTTRGLLLFPLPVRSGIPLP